MGRTGALADQWDPEAARLSGPDHFVYAPAGDAVYAPAGDAVEVPGGDAVKVPGGDSANGAGVAGDDDELLGPGWDEAARWRCGCGYVNAGFDRCPSCGARRSRSGEGRQATGPGVSALEAWERPAHGPVAPRRAPHVDSKVARTVAGVILFNVVVQAVGLAVAAGQGLETGDAIRQSLFWSLIFFAVTALWVLGRSTILGVRPVLRSGRAWAGAAEGVVVGGGLAIVITAGARLATGHAVLDPVASLIASESVGPLLIGIFVLVVAAPVVEELVFRGFLAEALRRRGTRVAGLVSAAAFSVAHLRFSQFRYYVAMGLILAFLYWRRGLVGSIAAHAAFNGMLVVAALAVAHGPALTLTADGATLTLPGTWQVAGAGHELAAVGPGGAMLTLGHVLVDAPGVEPEHLAQNLRTGRFALPAELWIEPGSVVVVDLPAGRTVWTEARVRGHEGRMVALLKGDRLWVASLTTGGSSRADRDFTDAMRSLRLP